MSTVQFETLELVEPWLYATLSGDTALSTLVSGRIVNTLSGAPVPLPYVIFSLQAPSDVRTLNGIIIGTSNVYLVKVVGTGASWGVIKEAGKRINILLGDKEAISTTVAGGSLTCVRERIIQEPEDRNGVQYRHLGGLYRIRASAHD